ncbi:MAG TPA: hypothetical protein VJ208_02155 [Candidatus Nanoarchaeia archaeon]|nr:hypothetical protein [Candidatus Nanoarchaeia archaeon]
MEEMNLASFLLSWGIGTSIGLAMFPGSLIIYNYIQDKIMSRNFMDVVAENLGRDYQNNISNQARAEIEKEKGLTPSYFCLWNSDLLNKYLKRHPEKRVEWQEELEHQKAVYRARFSRNDEYIEVPQISGLLE